MLHVLVTCYNFASSKHISRSELQTTSSNTPWQNSALHKFMELLKSFYTAERRTACKQNWPFVLQFCRWPKHELKIFFRDFGNLTPTVNSRLVTPPRRRKWFLLGKHKQFVSIELETRLEKSLSGRHKTPITGRAVDREKLNKKYCGTQFQSGKAAR